MLFKIRDVVAVDDHLNPTFVIGIPCLFVKFLVDVILHVEEGCPGAILMLVGGVVGVVGPRLEERGDGVDEEEDQEDDVKGKVSLSCLCLLLGV